MGATLSLFLLFLLLTVALLVAVVVTGLTARVRPHLVLVALTVAALGITIYYAVQLGGLYDLESAGRITPVHLALAKLTTVSYLAPLVTGLMTLRNRAHKRLHFRWVLVVLALTAASACTGAWMLLAANPLAA